MNSEDVTLIHKLQSELITRNTFAEVLITIAHDSKQDVVVRDYAVQHLSSIDPSQADRRIIVNALWGAISEDQSSIAGTALLGLIRLSKEWPAEVEVDKIRRAAYRLASDEHCGELSRITALQVCGQMREKNALSLAVRLAEETKSIALQTAAIAAMGMLGDGATQELLQQYATNENPRLAVAGQAALRDFKNARRQTSQ